MSLAGETLRVRMYITLLSAVEARMIQRVAIASGSQTEQTDIVQHGAQPYWLNNWPRQEINLCFFIH